MTIRKNWEWTIRHLDKDGDCMDIHFYDATKSELKRALKYMNNFDLDCELQLTIYLRYLDSDEMVIDTDYATVDLNTMTLPNEMDGGSSIPKYIRKQLK